MYEITNDAEFIKYCITHPAVWRHIHDDAAKNIDPKLYFPPMSGVIYIKAGEFGLILGKRLNYINYDVHIALLPNARGRAVEICRGAMEWFLKASDLPLRLTASIPSNRQYVIKLAEKIGMQYIGVNKKSFLLNGVLYDQIIYGISKEDLCHQ